MLPHLPSVTQNPSMETVDPVAVSLSSLPSSSSDLSHTISLSNDDHRCPPAKKAKQSSDIDDEIESLKVGMLPTYTCFLKF